jgi:hypothetical protein
LHILTDREADALGLSRGTPPSAQPADANLQHSHLVPIPPWVSEQVQIGSTWISRDELWESYRAGVNVGVKMRVRFAAGRRTLEWAVPIDRPSLPKAVVAVLNNIDTLTRAVSSSGPQRRNRSQEDGESIPTR